MAKGYSKTNPQELVNVLKGNRDDAIKITQEVGVNRARELLENAERELQFRLSTADGLGGQSTKTFTYEQSRIALRNVQSTLAVLKKDMQKLLLDEGTTAAQRAAVNVFDYLGQANETFGAEDEIPNIKVASIMDTAKSGTRSSILRRIASDDSIPGQTRQGVLDRYGTSVIGDFEQRLQTALLTRKSWAETRQSLIDDSAFLQGQPKFWAERIVRTELMGAYNRANWETMREVDNTLGDMCKILCATFDNRTSADSYAVHGQIRTSEEAFETWQGLFQHPPARPNDREVVVPHRIVWPIPPYLTWKSDGEIAARWRMQGNKRPVPPRPLMTTIPLEKFGKG